MKRKKSRHQRMSELIQEARKKYPQCKDKSDSYVRGWVKAGLKKEKDYAN